jgi:hypothetical protein
VNETCGRYANRVRMCWEVIAVSVQAARQVGLQVVIVFRPARLRGSDPGDTRCLLLRSESLPCDVVG